MKFKGESLNSAFGALVVTWFYRVDSYQDN